MDPVDDEKQAKPPAVIHLAMYGGAYVRADLALRVALEFEHFAPSGPELDRALELVYEIEGNPAHEQDGGAHEPDPPTLKDAGIYGEQPSAARPDQAVCDHSKGFLPIEARAFMCPLCEKVIAPVEE